MIREREAMGLSEITLLPAMAEARRTLSDFAAKVIARYQSVRASRRGGARKGAERGADLDR